MAGQGPSRRELLQALGLASMASLHSGFVRWGYAMAEGAPQHAHGASTSTHVRPLYQPQFFSPGEYKTTELLTELILPATPAHGSQRSQPGARQAGVAEFIDFIVFSDASLQASFRSGLQWLDQASAPASSFAAAPAAEQVALLGRLAYAAQFRESEKQGQAFFKLMRKYVVTGFYTSRIGLQSLDYPGLTFYGVSPGCTHHDNPEHVGL